MRRAGEFRNGIAGLDINGWRDCAVRNWELGAEGIAVEVPDGLLVEGGVLSSIVQVGPAEDRRWVAGPGARLAPHGRGEGWGARGARHLRRLLRQKFEPDGLTLTFQELATRPAIALLAIPDVERMDDRAREARLAALRRGGARRSVLAWSSVLICLYHLSKARLDVGSRVGVVELDNAGLRLQILEIREREGLSVPRRRHFGQHIDCSFGLAARERQAGQDLVAQTSDRRVSTVIDCIDLPGLLAMAQPGTKLRDVVRLSNGDWVELEGIAPDLKEFSGDISSLESADLILLHAPTEPGLTQALAEQIGRHLGPKIVTMPSDAPARGAYLAGKRLSQGLPMWFDFLPSIDTIVSQGSKAESLRIVPDDADFEAGKVWISPEPIELQWPGQEHELRVWLRKEDYPRPRRAPARIASAPAKSVKVHLRVEQAPAQDRAKLTLTSPDWAPLRDAPAVVEWEDGEDDPRDWKTIIEEESGPRPTIPDRVVLPADVRMWTEEGANLSEVLQNFDGSDFTPVYRALSQRRKLDWNSSNPELFERQYYAIDSDGDPPAGIDPDDWRRLGVVIASAEAKLLSGEVRNNHPFGVLSWTFRRCPETIWPIAIHVLKSGGGKPAFSGWHTMYPQGLGRIAGNRDAFRATIKYLNSLGETWNMNQQACASFLLSRNDEVFEHLDRQTIDSWADQVCSLLERQSNDLDGQRNRYLPTLIAGLLRWRLQEPLAFTLRHDPKGLQIVERLDKLIKKIAGRIEPRHLQSYSELRPFFDEDGGNPNILQKLFDRV